MPASLPSARHLPHQQRESSWSEDTDTDDDFPMSTIATKAARPTKDDDWDGMYKKLLQVKNQHGSLDQLDGDLHAWASEQRVIYAERWKNIYRNNNQQLLIDKRIRKLHDIGFDFARKLRAVKDGRRKGGLYGHETPENEAEATLSDDGSPSLYGELYGDSLQLGRKGGRQNPSPTFSFKGKTTKTKARSPCFGSPPKAGPPTPSPDSVMPVPASVPMPLCLTGKRRSCEDDDDDVDDDDVDDDDVKAEYDSDYSPPSKVIKRTKAVPAASTTKCRRGGKAKRMARVDAKTGEIVEIFPSCKDAARVYLSQFKSLDSYRQSLSNTAHGNRDRCPNGYLWRYLDAMDRPIDPKPASASKPDNGDSVEKGESKVEVGVDPWDAMFEELQRSKCPVTGDYLVDRKRSPELHSWVGQQRRLLRNAPDRLSDAMKGKLKSVGLTAPKVVEPSSYTNQVTLNEAVSAAPARLAEATSSSAAEATAPLCNADSANAAEPMVADTVTSLDCETGGNGRTTATQNSDDIKWDNIFQQFLACRDQATTSIEDELSKDSKLQQWFGAQRTRYLNSVRNKLKPNEPPKRELLKDRLDKLLKAGLDLDPDGEVAKLIKRHSSTEPFTGVDDEAMSEVIPAVLAASAENADEAPRSGTSAPASTIDKESCNAAEIFSVDSVGSPVANPSLPHLDSSFWVVPENRLQQICHFYNLQKSCKHGLKCGFIHIQNPWGEEALEKIWSESDKNLPEFLTDRQYETRVHGFSAFEEDSRWYTARYSTELRNSFSSSSGSDRTIIFAEGGPTAVRSAQGVCWYSNEKDALAALKRTVIVTYWAVLNRRLSHSNLKGPASQILAKRLSISAKRESTLDRTWQLSGTSSHQAHGRDHGSIVSSGFKAPFSSRTSSSDMPPLRSEGRGTHYLSNHEGARGYGDLPKTGKQWIKDLGEKNCQFFSCYSECHGRRCPDLHVLSPYASHIPAHKLREYFPSDGYDFDSRVHVLAKENDSGRKFYTAAYKKSNLLVYVEGGRGDPNDKQIWWYLSEADAKGALYECIRRYL